MTPCISHKLADTREKAYLSQTRFVRYFIEKKNICFLIRNMLKFVAGDSIHNNKVLSQVLTQH